MRPHQVAFYRCAHRPSRRIPAPTPTDPTRELCTSCGGTFHRDEE